ncbi:MAG: uroporphyrinogen-III synthase [Caulobacter sp.]|uniref:uroporphyrinogen-III synthase n=1 Tax=Phenylobacterium sp. TaxID=1871053 RepID=UPI00271AE5ED|nr:uroporphyrinogen-III synthase [Phenylobacterium sp.]MDO8900122.1 uroporphyrinogen-III synthase [Phenylobacterium sp.]MDP2259956.1 uroporphyrinogen-III synthase [Caulobacter sp.]
MTAPPRRLIWITRAEPGATATAARLRALGHMPLVLPLLEVRPVTETAPDLAGVGALAFTSANGVRVFAQLSEVRALPVFAVGAACAQAARAAGFRQVLSADGDVAALAAGIASRAEEFRGAVLHPAATEPAGDLAGALARTGVACRTAPIYATVPVTPPAAALDQALRAEAALVYSPKAARQLAMLMRGRQAPDLRALCLSKAVARPLARARIGPRAYAPVPLESALLNLIDRAAPPVAEAS